MYRLYPLVVLILFNGLLTAQPKTRFRVLKFKTLAPGQTFTIPIYNACNPANRPIAKSELDSIVKDLMSIDSFTFTIEFHNNCRADSAYNRAYTQRHADSTVAYLNRKSGHRLKLTAIGYGEDSLVNHCRCEAKYNILVPCYEDQHQENRRMVIRITGIRKD